MKQGIELNNKDYKVIARHIMQAIQLDNGYGHVEGISLSATIRLKIESGWRRSGMD